MKPNVGLRNSGVQAAIAAALLFGAGTPFAKRLLGNLSPWLLAGLLYFGSGVGLTTYQILRRAPRLGLAGAQWRWLAGAIMSGGVIGPVLLMFGLSGMSASGASLLLNAEGIFTTLLAWFVFRESFDRRIAVGMILIVAGVLVLSWPGEGGLAASWSSLAVAGACLAWAIDNNLTRKLALADAVWIAAVKGLSAGTVNLVLALSLGAALPPLLELGAAMAVGVLAYGVSLVAFVVGLRHLGTARTGAYFPWPHFLGRYWQSHFLVRPSRCSLSPRVH